MRRINNILTILGRIGTVLISTVAYLFFFLGTRATTTPPQMVSIIASIIVFGGISLVMYRTRNTQLITLLPLSILAGFVVYFFFGGFTGTLSFVIFVLTALLLSVFTILSYYSWNNSLEGGITYTALGVFYAMISFTRVPMNSLILVVASLFLTGVCLMLSKVQVSR